MTKSQIAATLSALALLSACAAPQYMWDHPTASRAQFDFDRNQCIYASAMSAGSYSSNTRYRSVVGQVIGDRIDLDKRRTELGELCMQWHGYTQRRIN